MTTIDLCLFLTSYTLTVAFAATAEFLRRREGSLLITVMAALAAVSAVTAVGFYIEPDKSYLDVLRYLIQERDFSTVVALAMGFAAAAVWLPRGLVPEDTSRSVPRRVEAVLLALTVIVVVASGQAFIWKDILGITRHAVEVDPPQFVIEKIANLDEQPIRVTASPDGRIYICYDYFKKHGAIGGAVLQLTQDRHPAPRHFISVSLLRHPSWFDATALPSETGTCTCRVRDSSPGPSRAW